MKLPIGYDIEAEMPKTFNPKLNYCTLCPDKIGKHYLGDICYWHDRQYRNEVKLRQTRLQADLDLFRGMCYRLPTYLYPIAVYAFLGCRTLSWLLWKGGGFRDKTAKFLKRIGLW